LQLPHLAIKSKWPRNLISEVRGRYLFAIPLSRGTKLAGLLTRSISKNTTVQIS